MSTTNLLATKFYIPRVRSSLVARPRLLERIDQGLQGKLTLISAVPGAGKTTLMAEWQAANAERRFPLVWVSLDEGDNDSTRFWSYIARAVETLAPAIGEDTQNLLHSFPTPPIESVLIALLNAINAAIQEDFALVLDDYHYIVNEAIYTSLTYVLDHLPPQMHIVLLTRVDPPLPLARLRVRRQLTEIRTADLRFTPAETIAYLTESMKLNISSENATRLAERTEGWIAGLQLAALSLQRQENSAGFLQTFNGNHRYVMEYLAQEVFEQQQPHMREFLQDTAILSRLSADLCNAVTGKSDGQEMLHALEKANLFLVSLDEEQHWYRYHTLFNDFLFGTLRKARSDDYICTLHIRAATWYEQHNMMHEAVHHMLASNDFKQAAQFIERVARSVWMRGEASTLRCWIRELPEDLLRARPQLGLFYVWSFIAENKLDEAQRHLVEVQQVLQQKAALGESSVEQASIQVEVIILQATIARFLNDVSRTLELSQQALKYLSQQDNILGSINTLNLGHAYRLQGNVEAATQAFKQSIALGRAVGNIYTILLAFNTLMQLEGEHGALRSAAEYGKEAMRFATRHGCEQLPIMGATYIKEGELSYERNMLQEATTWIERGIEVAKRGSTRFLPQGYMAQARLLHARERVEQANDILEQALGIAREQSSTLLLLQIAALQARLWLAQNQLALAFSWLKQTKLSVEDTPEYVHEFEYLTLVRLLIAQGKAREVVALLERLRQAAANGGRTGTVIEVFLLQALANAARDQNAEACIALERALVLAEPEGYRRLFVDEGARMIPLLTTFLAWQKQTGMSKSIIHRYANGLLQQLADSYTGPLDTSSERKRESVHQSGSTPLIEALGDREMEVLHYLAAGLSNQAIADEMVVALSTIKSHLKSIYRKLDVESRTHAVARARELNLL